MTIDRHNYEELFILYWDDELTAAQKQAVENFVSQNPDLQIEFKILGETRFTPDKNIQFEEKDFLHTDSLINITNYEEELLNYIDDELTPDRKREVEKFAGKLSAVQQELALLQKTKLQPETQVVFPDKSTLYRREEKVRVISMTWFRVAVAAAIILIAGFTAITLVNNRSNNIQPPVAKVDDSNKQPNQATTTEQAAKNKTEGTSLATVDKKVNTVNPSVEKNNKKQENNTTSTTEYVAENKNNLPKERNRANEISTDPSASDAVVAELALPNIEKKEFGNAAKNETNAIHASPEKGVTLQPGYALNIETPTESPKEGGGIKEFLRKTTRVFERRTKINTTTEDNKLLVGAFAVSLK